jgi:HK97 family phage prohead protease
MTRQRITTDEERRSNPSPVELRSAKGDRVLGGYAAVFGSPSRDLGGFREIVENSAFNKSAADGWPNVVCRADHNAVLGSTRGKTLALAVDKLGLDFEVDVARTAAGNDVLELVSRRDYAGSSFAFNCDSDEWRSNGSILLRHLVSVRLIDVSPCAIPAYEAATVSLRSLAAQVDAPLDDVLELARAGQLPKLLSRSDIDGGRPKSMTPQRRQLEAMRPKSGRQALLETMALRWPAPPQQTRLRKQLTDTRYPDYQTAASVGLKTLEG